MIPREISRRAMRTLFALLDAEDGQRHTPSVDLVPSRLTRRETTVTDTHR
jgi:hypothetical protein